MNKDIFRQVSVVLATLATITMNILANALPLNGQNTGAISDRFQVYFVPAGYVFAIWGLIYIGMLAYAIFQALPSQRTNPRMRSTGWLFVAAGAANVAWLFFWHYNIFALTLVAMLALLALLVMIYLRLGTGRVAVSTAERWCAQIPFSVYLGWITVATIANITDVLWLAGWNGAPLRPEVWAVIMLAAAVIITGLVLFTRRDIAYASVIIWATIGIAIKQSAVDLVPTAAWITAAAVVLLMIIAVVRVPSQLQAPASARS
jgi:translocator protein